jgi:hypothetical protein
VAKKPSWSCRILASALDQRRDAIDGILICLRRHVAVVLSGKKESSAGA